MAQISITIPNDKINEVVDAICSQYGWTADTGLTKPQFAKKVVADFVKEIYQSHEGTKAAENARATKLNELRQIDIN